ncbi:MAG: methionyl-tRNA formyltransferase [Xanthobacteraceae bacterium]
MRIGYLGDGPWAHQALALISSEPDWEVVFIGARYPTPDPVLRLQAEQRSLPFFCGRDVNAAETVGAFAALRPDVIVSVSFDQIMRRALIDLPLKGLINCHAGALPFYRGRNVLNWVLINGEASFGVTIHYVDEGIDTGDIIYQRQVPIDPTDDYADLLTKAFAACAETLHKALQLIAAGKAPRVPQSSIHPVGFYCGKRRSGDERIDWSWPAERLHNFIRGVAPPGPGARTNLGDRQFALLKSEPVPEGPIYIGTVGEVVGRDQGGVTVKCADRTIRITRAAQVRSDGTVAAPIVPSFPIGTRFQSVLS